MELLASWMDHAKWVEFWNQSDSIYVPKLSTLALRKCMMTLEKAILYGEKTKTTTAGSWYDFLKRIIENEDFVKELTDYHKPCRELLLCTNLMTDYHMLIRSGCNYGIAPGDYEMFDSEDDTIKSLIFWLCFENTDSRKIHLLFNIELGKGKDICDVVFEYIVGNKENMLQCHSLELMFEKPDPRFRPTIQDISTFFLKFSRLEVLDIEARDLRTDEPIWTIEEKSQLLEAISKFQNLKSLKIHLDEKEIPCFCQFVEKSPNTLEVLMIKFRCKAKEEVIGVQANEMLCVLKKLTKLRKIVLQLEPKFYDIDDFEWCDYGNPEEWQKLINSTEPIKDPIDFVKTVIVSAYSSICLKLIDKHFKNVENLTLSLNGYGDANVKLFRIADDESLVELENLKPLQHFKVEVINEEAKDYPIGISTIIKLFPNLQELHTNFIEVDSEHLEEVPIFESLKKLVLLNDAVDPLSLIYKMPNLEKVILIKKTWKSQVDKTVLKNYLPKRCELLEEDEDKMGCYRFITTRDRT